MTSDRLTSIRRTYATVRRARPTPLALVLALFACLFVATSCAGLGSKAPAATESVRPSTEHVGPRRPVHQGPLVGVFRNTSSQRVGEFESWLGRPVDLVVDYASGQNWDQISNPDYLLKEWQGRPYRLVYGVPMLPSVEEATFDQGAKGAYDQHFYRLGERLVETGHADSILRIGLEVNVEGNQWGVASPEEYVTFWRRIAETMQKVPGQQFLFDWNIGNGSQVADGPAYYPGDHVVDIVGVDVYDLTGASGAYPYPAECDAACRKTRQQKAWDGEVYGSARGLKFWSDFARQHGKPMSLPEWGLWTRPDGTGGGENPGFIRHMHEFIKDPDNNVLYHAYFDYNGDDGEHSMIDTFHKSGKVFRELFG